MTITWGCSGNSCSSRSTSMPSFFGIFMSSTTTSYGVSRSRAQRGLAVAHAVHFGPAPGQLADDQLAQVLLVVGHQHPDRAVHRRQHHAEDTPLADVRLHLDASSVIGHDALRDREAEARSLPGGLVVKNGSKMRARTSSGIPGPSSSNSISTSWRARRVRMVRHAAAVHRVERVRAPARGTPGGAAPRSPPPRQRAVQLGGEPAPAVYRA